MQRYLNTLRFSGCWKCDSFTSSRNKRGNVEDWEATTWSPPALMISFHFFWKQWQPPCFSKPKRPARSPVKPVLHSSCALNCCQTKRRLASNVSHHDITHCQISSASQSLDSLPDTRRCAPCDFLASFIFIIFRLLPMPDSSSRWLSYPCTLRSHWHAGRSMLSDCKIPPAPPLFRVPSLDTC